MCVRVLVLDNKICMVHDLAESLVGDITPYDGVSKEDKRKLEEVRNEIYSIIISNIKITCFFICIDLL